MSKKYALLVDLRKCVGCNSCQVSCKMENAAPIGQFRSKVDIADMGEYPKPKRYFFPKICNQCDEPPCILPCPTGATYKREDGVVMVDRDICIGCGRCVGACPYGARFIHPHIPVKNDPSKYAKDVPEVKGKKAKDLRVVDKCDFCSHRLAAGIEEPACVRNCMGRARTFGDLNDSNSAVSKLKASEKTETWHPDYGTKPRVHFIAPDKEVFKTADGLINQ
ncbi:MAG: 4Fe-4S dicluster domain-containing protein [Nitrospirota bacterium]